MGVTFEIPKATVHLMNGQHILYNKVMNEETLRDVLCKLRIGLSEILKDRLEGIYLYGSQARGEARVGSDIDVIIVLERDFEYGEMLDQTIDLVADLSLEFDVVISRTFVSKERFQNEMSPFYMNVRREAVPV
jgi:predicted nucleotidyltransferase